MSNHNSVTSAIVRLRCVTEKPVSKTSKIRESTG
jgi:hypothetical protein